MELHTSQPRDGAKEPRKLVRGESAALRRDRYQRIFATLNSKYPNSVTALHFRTPFELVVATVLSAQTTDKRVNMITPSLFAQFPSVDAMAEASLESIEAEIKTIGFFRQKAKSLQRLAMMVRDEFRGEVPSTMDELVKLPGVGRKTANVVLGDAFHAPVGIAVDTHVIRLTGRLGLTKHTDPVLIETDLLKLATQPQYTQTSHVLIYHGRETCHAKKPNCSGCEIREECPSAGFAGSV